MTEDITKRLRVLPAELLGRALMYPPEVVRLFHEAAAEIERLRKENQEMRDDNWERRAAADNLSE